MIADAQHPERTSTQIDLGQILQPEAASCQHCLERFAERLRAVEGILNLRFEKATATVDYDPSRISESSVDDLAREAGQEIDGQFVHEVVPIEGMTCADCAMTLERGVSRLPGVRFSEVNFAGARMSIEYAHGQTDMDAISRRVSDLGYRVSEETDEQPQNEQGALVSFLTRRTNLQTAAGGLLTIIGAAIHLSPAPVNIAIGLYIAAILIAGVPIARKAFASAWTARQLDINMLMTIAVIGAAFIGEWLEAAVVVVLFSVGEALEGYTADRARRSIRSLMQLAPSEALVRRAGEDREQRLPVSEIVPGDTVIVRSGDRIAIDGFVTSGMSSVNQAPVTGESLPVEKDDGDQVFAGTMNGSGVLEIQATRKANDSTIARIIRMIEDAQAQKAPTQRFVDVFARYYTPAVVALAATVAVAPPLVMGAEWSTWIYRALVLLVIACPCALVISTPVSIVSAISRAARNGVLIKGGAFLEAAGSLRALAFDKTGTLTKGRPEVTAVIPLNGTSEADALRYAAAAERYSEHPLGEAIVRMAVNRDIDPYELTVSDTTAQAGRGIEAMIDGKTVRVGTRNLVLDRLDAGLSHDAERHLIELEEAGQTAVLVSVDDRLIGVIGMADELRAEAKSAIAALHEAGIRQVVMLTGDRTPVARAIASKLGIDSVEAELMPEQKVAAVERLQAEHGQIGMIGDGVNDAPAMARASVGIAMGAAGTDTALETADIALMSDDLGKVAFTMQLSQAARRVIGQNIALSLAIKLIFLGLAVFGAATLWMAVFADVGAALIVIANGMRLLQSSKDN